MRAWTSFLIRGSLAASVLAAAAAGVAQDRRTVWDGVFNVEQAERGRLEFELYCTDCHQDLTNASDNTEFLRNWGEDNLVSLFDVVRESMPDNDPGSLTDAAYVDILAYLLDGNGFPAGDDELVIAELPAIRVEAADGPGEVPDASLVTISGCLSESDGRWMVSQATAPARTRDPSASSDEDLEAMIDAPLGVGTFELIYVFPAPRDRVGHRVEAKGFLIRDADPDQINTSSVATIAAECP